MSLLYTLTGPLPQSDEPEFRAMLRTLFSRPTLPSLPSTSALSSTLFDAQLPGKPRLSRRVHLTHIDNGFVQQV